MGNQLWIHTLYQERQTISQMKLSCEVLGLSRALYKPGCLHNRAQAGCWVGVGMLINWLNWVWGWGEYKEKSSVREALVWDIACFTGVKHAQKWLCFPHWIGMRLKEFQVTRKLCYELLLFPHKPRFSLIGPSCFLLVWNPFNHHPLPYLFYFYPQHLNHLTYLLTGYPGLESKLHVAKIFVCFVLCSIFSLLNSAWYSISAQ